MAGGAIIDVTPGDDGYDFHRDDGSSVFLLSTPETDELASRISSFKSQGMLAQNASSSDSASDAGPMMSVAPPLPPPPPAMSAAPPPAPEPVNAGTAGPLASLAEVPPPAAPVQTGPYDPQGAADFARLVATRPGSAGITQQQLQAKAAQAVEMPKGSQVTVEGASPYDEELAAQRASATEMRREAMASQSIDSRLTAQQEADDAQALQQVIQNQISPARQALQKIELGVENDRKQYRALRDEVANGKIKPYYQGVGGAFSAIGAAIASAMGAYGAAMTGTKNFALDIINSAIDRDVQTQMDEFARKGQAADNMYRDLVNAYGDRDQAKLALEGLQREAAKAQASYTAARAKDAAAQNTLQEWMANDLFQEAETERKIREQSYGKHTQTVSAEMAYPRAASGPSFDRKAYADYYLKAMESQGKQAQTQLDMAKGEAEIGKLRADAAKAQREAEGGASPEDRRAFTAQMQLVDTGLGIVEGLAKEGKMKIDPKTGTIERDGDIPGVGYVDNNLVGTLSKEGTNFKQKLMLAIPAIQKSIEGDAASETAIAEIKNGLDLNNETAVAAGLNALYSTLQKRKAAVEAGSTGAVRANRAQEKRNVNIERAQSAVGSGGLPSPERF